MSESGRSWVFTLNNWTDEEEKTICEMDYRYLCYGYEGLDTETPHLQGYIEFEDTQRLSALRKLVRARPNAIGPAKKSGPVYWATRKGSREEARNYTQKEGSWQEFGNWESGGQGARTDIYGLVKKINDGVDLIDLMEDCPELVSRNLRFVEKYKALAEKRSSASFRKVHVQCLIGDAGCGKTRKAHEENPGIFTVNADEAFPFDGYEGEETILLDDFYGNMKYHVLLRVLDGHQFRVNVKGSSRYAKWNKIVITSNKRPDEWYQQGMTEALSRRLSETIIFSNENSCNEVAGNIVEVETSRLPLITEEDMKLFQEMMDGKTDEIVEELTKIKEEICEQKYEMSFDCEDNIAEISDSDDDSGYETDAEYWRILVEGDEEGKEYQKWMDRCNRGLRTSRD